MFVLLVDEWKDANNNMAARNHTVWRLVDPLSEKAAKHTFVTAAPLVRFYTIL